MTLARRLSSWLPAALLAFVAASFLLPNGPSYALVFYVAVLPCLAARLIMGRPDLDDPARVLAMALVVWSGMTLLWGQDDGHRSWRFAGDSLATGGFLLAMITVLGEARVRTTLARILVAAGAANAAFAIAVFFITHPVFRRLTGWGATSHPILGAAVMAVAGLTALARVLVPHAPPRRRMLNLAAALVVWSGMTLLWGQDDGHRSWRFAGDSLATGGFLLAMITVLGEARVRTALARVLVTAGAANAAFAIAVFFITHPVFRRLTGWGATSHPILGAAVMAVAGLTALARVLVPHAPPRRRMLNLAAALVMAAFILMTESRGPLLAAGIGVVFLCVASVWRVRALAGLAVLIVAWFSLPQAARQRSEAVLIERGSSHRFEVWDYTLGLIRDRPLLGHGLAANLHLTVGASGRPNQITFPHDLYLSLLFYSGAVGLLIFVALAAVLTWRLASGVKRQDDEWPWLSALWLNVLVVGLTDLGQITKGPGPIWFIVWLPVGLLLTRLGRRPGALPLDPAGDKSPNPITW